MPSTIVEVTNYDASISVPNPGEPVRAAGATGVPITLAGADGNGGLTFSALVTGATVVMLGGTSQTLAVTVSGLAITIQLGTNGGGSVTSTAAQVVTAYNLVTAATSLATISYTGTGASAAAATSGTVQLAQGAAGSIRPAEQSFANRTNYLKAEADNTIWMPWKRPTVWCQDGATLNLSQLQSLALQTAAGPPFYYTILSYAGGTFAPTVGNSTRYYLYLYLSGGVATPFQSTTAPDATNSCLSTSPLYRYVCSYVTNSSGVIMPFQFDGLGLTIMTLQDTQGTSGLYPYVLNAGAATTWTNIALTTGSPPLLPKYATSVRLSCDLTNPSGAACWAEVKAGVDSTTGHVGRMLQNSLNTSTLSDDVEIGLVGGGSVSYRVNQPGTGGVYLNMTVMSYRE